MATFQKSYYFVSPLRTLDVINQKRTAVQTDPVRTAHEKRTEADRLSQQKQMMFAQVHNALKTDWGVLKGEYIQLKREKTAAVDRAAKRWDYQRLDYDRKSAREFLKGASLTAIEKRLSDIELSGDTHALLAFAEEGVNILGKERAFTDMDLPRLGDLLNGLGKMREDLTVTPEMKELAKQGEILTQKVRDVFEATHRAKSEYYTVDSLGNVPNSFDEMTKGVNVRVRVDPETLAEITEVNLDWD